MIRVLATIAVLILLVVACATEDGVPAPTDAGAPDAEPALIPLCADLCDIGEVYCLCTPYGPICGCRNWQCIQKGFCGD